MYSELNLLEPDTPEALVAELDLSKPPVFLPHNPYTDATREHNLRSIIQSFILFIATQDMASRFPKLNTSNLPALSEEAASATASPARGKEMRTNLLQKLRPPPLVHAWDFWHDRQDRNKKGPRSSPPPEESSYEDRLVKMTEVTDVREFWEMFNNFDVTSLPLRDSVHLFHKGVKPVWEDPRNLKGGCWTFRVPKEKAKEFWKEICMMAIGEKLQEAVASKRITFIDDICGISLSVRFTSTLITIWNRDADHTSGVQKILEVVLNNLPPELQPKNESAYYYKKHSEHAGFKAPPTTEAHTMGTAAAETQ